MFTLYFKCTVQRKAPNTHQISSETAFIEVNRIAFFIPPLFSLTVQTNINNFYVLFKKCTWACCEWFSAWSGFELLREHMLGIKDGTHISVLEIHPHTLVAKQIIQHFSDFLIRIVCLFLFSLLHSHCICSSSFCPAEWIAYAFFLKNHTYRISSSTHDFSILLLKWKYTAITVHYCWKITYWYQITWNAIY